MGISGSFCEQKNSFVLVSGGEVMDGGLWAAKGLLSF